MLVLKQNGIQIQAFRTCDDLMLRNAAFEAQLILLKFCWLACKQEITETKKGNTTSKRWIWILILVHFRSL